MTPKEIMKNNQDKCGAELKAVDEFLSKQERMCEDFSFFIECISGRKIDPMHSHTIATCKPALPPLGDYYNPPVAYNQNQEGITPMCFNAPASKKANYNTSVVAISGEASVEATQRDFTTDRVRQILSKHRDALRKQFNMDANEAPRTAKDLIKVITDGDYTLDEKRLEDHAEELHYFNNFFGIRWGKGKPDTAGFKLAVTALDERAQEVIDEATLSTPDKLLGILADFKAWTYKAKK